MLIELLLDAIYSIFSALTSVINIPLLPPDFYSIFDQGFSYLATGASILSNYTYLPYLFILFGIILVVDVSVYIFKVVMWVLRKIPFVNIS